MVKQVRRFLFSLFSLFLDKADQRNLTALGHAVTWGQVSWAEGAIMFDKSLDCTDVSSDSLTGWRKHNFFEKTQVHAAASLLDAGASVNGTGKCFPCS